ncbi:MAG TPA: tetratricopeptide repeat protein [Terriglobales bacterium]|nr:tetratricopeptide repeat protein [Terriglobales bacterium]
MPPRRESASFITLSPDSSYCHHCFGWLLYKAHELAEAAKEFRTAIQLDPVDPDPHSGLGVVLREQKHNEDALKEFLEALRLGLDTGAIHREIGSVYLAQKRNGDAILELKQSVSRSPADARAHLFLAQAFEADGNMNDAIAEYRQAAMLAGSNNVGGEQITKSLAAALEKDGRSREALETYKSRYEALPKEETKADYDAARKRLGSSSDGGKKHEAKLTGAPGTQKPIVSASAAKADAEAAQLPILFQQKFDGMQKAMMQQHWNQAEELGNGAVALAEKMVPHDERLISALRALAQIYAMERKFSQAEKQDFRALRASEDLFGPKSMTSQSVLNDLGGLYVRSQNLPQAIEYLNRALAIADGPTNAVPALERLGDVYLQQGDFKNAEQAYKKMLADEEAHYGPGTFGTIAGLERMGQLYCNTHDYAQAQNFFERMLAIEEKQFGPNSTMLQGSLDHLATALHGLGKDEEARALEHRRQVIAQNQVH